MGWDSEESITVETRQEFYLFQIYIPDLLAPIAYCLVGKMLARSAITHTSPCTFDAFVKPIPFHPRNFQLGVCASNVEGINIFAF